MLRCFTVSSIDDAEQAALTLEMRANSPREKLNALYRKREVLGSLGRMKESQQSANEWFMVAPGLNAQPGVTQIVKAITTLETAVPWQADTTGLESALLTIKEHAAQLPPFARPWLANAAVIRALSGNPAEARALLTLNDQTYGQQDTLPAVAAWAAALARANAVAAIAQAERDPGLSAALQRFDSIFLSVTTLGASRSVRNIAQLLHARVLEATGDRARALALLRRREVNDPPFYPTTFYREEGRLAALTGDRQRAIRSYQLYLALRKSPDASVRADVDWVARELQRLTSEAR